MSQFIIKGLLEISNVLAINILILLLLIVVILVLLVLPVIIIELSKKIINPFINELHNLTCFFNVNGEDYKCTCMKQLTFCM